jgi:hypothetical protein
VKTWLARVRRMTRTDYVTAIEVAGLAMWIEVALEVMPFARVLQRVGRLPSRGVAPAIASDDLQRLTRFVAVAYEVLPFPATCLRESLVLHALLARRGVESRVCFGVARHGTTLDAHAWIECDDLMREDVAGRFSELRGV